MENFGTYNGAHGAEAFGFRKLAKVYWNLQAPRLYEEALSRNEAMLASGGALVAETGAHTGRSPKDKFVVRDALTQDSVWWDNNGAISQGAVRHPARGLQGPCTGQGALRAGPLWRRRPALPRQDARLHRICLALAVHPQPAHPPAMGGAGRLRARDDHRRPALVQGGPGAPRLPLGDRDRLRLLAPHRADRRHELRRRDEEIGLHLSELRPAREGRDADALLGQRRRRATTWPCSSACPAPARRRSRPTRTARSSATTSMAGGRVACSTSRAAATPRRSSCRARPSRRSTPPPSASAP